MFFAVTALLILAPQTSTAGPATAQAIAPNVKEKKVCRKDQNSVSRVAHLTCHARSEWAEIEKGTARDADLMGARVKSD